MGRVCRGAGEKRGRQRCRIGTNRRQENLPAIKFLVGFVRLCCRRYNVQNDFL